MADAEFIEPPLSCPHIDAFIAATNPPTEVLAELEAVRNINSQLRYGLWYEKLRAETAAEEEREACASIADGQVVCTNTRDIHVAMQEAAAEDAAQGIAASIRNRSQIQRGRK